MVDTEIAYELLVNGSFWPAIDSYYSIVFNGWFWGLLLMTVITLVFLKTKSAVAVLSTTVIGTVIMYLTGLLNQPVMNAMLIVMIISLGATIYTWFTK
jgi:hypothetical protein